MTDRIPLPPPDHTEDVQGFVHDTKRHYYAEETMRAYAERLHAARVKTLPTQLMAGLQTEIDALRHQLQTLAELGDGSGDAQILRMGYAAARLEIESLNTQLQAAREEIKLRDAQEAAIGAGGVEPLRRRVCLHKISEPISAGEYPALPERIADETVKAWQERGDMPGYAFDFRGLIADGIRRASHGKAPAHAAEEQPLPLLVRDIADDLGTTPIQVCIALSKLGFAGHSVNMVVTPQMAKSLRAHFATTAQAAPADVAGPSKAVAYLDIGSGGYLDIGTNLDDEELLKLPRGRHMLAIVGTFGVDGYVPVSVAGLSLEQLLRDARHRIANLSRASVPFEDPLDGPILKALDAAIAAAPTTQAAPQPAASHGLVLVPKRMTRAMEDVVNDEGWQWEDLLAAVGAITDQEYAEISDKPKAAAPAAHGDALDAAFEAVRHRLCGMQRYSFVLDDDGVVRRVEDRTGRWIEFDDAHELFDPVAVDAARSQAKEGGA